MKPVSIAIPVAIPVAISVASAVALLAACSSSKGDEPSKDLFESLPSGTPVVQSTNLGPVRAEIRIRPAEPRLGDVVYLELKVTAPPAVDIEMPQFGEALGRFSIVDYDWRDSRDGANAVREQLYQLQAAASGKVRLPQLRIEVTDRRPDAEETGTRELLTDELLLTVAPIELALGDDDIHPNLGKIGIKPVRPWHHWWFWFALAATALVIVVLILISGIKRAALVARKSAYDQAIERLSELRGAGLPEDDEIDSWYVELSSVIRHYLEGRFSVRAPELTTEEFLREAQRSAELSATHRQTLGDFLARCDRVKFAGDRPSPSEQNEAMAGALRFVKETRPREVAA